MSLPVAVDHPAGRCDVGGVAGHHAYVGGRIYTSIPVSRFLLGQHREMSSHRLRRKPASENGNRERRVSLWLSGNPRQLCERMPRVVTRRADCEGCWNRTDGECTTEASLFRRPGYQTAKLRFIFP